MLMNRRHALFSETSRQKGAVLVVGLVMLLLMTVVGLAAIRGSGMQELMAGNMRDRNLSFQAAEAGLRSGEAILVNTAAMNFDGNNGLYPDLSLPGSTPGVPTHWTGANWEANAATGDEELDGLFAQPRYVVEELPRTLAPGAEGGAVDFASQLTAEEVLYYRVTSRATGGSENAVTILQSVVRP